MGKYLAPLLALLLAGCGAKGLTTSMLPVCDALLGPIKTNSAKPSSKRYLPPSSTDLRADIKARNQVGTNLNCPAYHK